MILVDTSVWIDYFNGNTTVNTDWLDSVVDQTSILMGDIILTEVLQGFQNDRDFKNAKEVLLQFPFMPMIGEEMALKSAENYRFLRKKGITIRKAVDVWIGTFCIHHQIPLLHNDKDFEPMEKYLKLKTVKTEKP